MRVKFYFSRRERVVLITLAVFAVLACALFLYIPSNSDKERRLITAEERSEIESLKDGAEASHNNASMNETKVSLFPFNPNTADSATLISLGLAHWQVRALLHYRAKGGQFRSVQDFSRLYGLRYSQYKRLAPYVRIPSDPLAVDVVKPNSSSSQKTSSREEAKTKYHSDKFVGLRQVDINEADTSLLKHIPGIGSYRAKKIVEYRNKLGGYSSLSQLHDIKIPDSIFAWFLPTSSGNVKKININKASFKQLLAHPYLNYEQVKCIFNYRYRNGDIKKLSELSLLNEFPEEAIKRIEPYIVY